MNKFEMQVDPKCCKHYIDAFDVIFIDDNRDLRFCRYCKPMAANVSGKYHMVVKDSNQTFDYITRDRALCFYDIDKHRWCSKVSDHRYKCWEVVVPEDDIFINVLVGIAIDEIVGSKTDKSVDNITSRIKCRFSNWYDEHTLQRHSEDRRWTSTSTIKVPDNFFDDSVRIPQTRNNVENGLQASATFDEFPLKPTPPNHTIYQLPQPKLVQFNDDYTTVVWRDGTHTTVKRTRGDAYDEEKAIMFAAIKRMRGNNGCSMDRYFKKFFENSVDISNKKKKEKKNGSNKKDNSEDNN